MTSNTNRIEKTVLLKAPLTRVWRALSDAAEFGSWFGVAFDNGRFEAGQRIQGKITTPGYEHVVFDVTVERTEPERLLSFRWHPYAIDPAVDYSTEPTTLVVFELEAVDGGTLLRVVESGFDALPSMRAREAFPMNTRGWEEQLRNIARHVGNA